MSRPQIIACSWFFEDESPQKLGFVLNLFSKHLNISILQKVARMSQSLNGRGVPKIEVREGLEGRGGVEPVDGDGAAAGEAAEPGHLAFGKLVDGVGQEDAHFFVGEDAKDVLGDEFVL